MDGLFPRSKLRSLQRRWRRTNTSQKMGHHRLSPAERHRKALPSPSNLTSPEPRPRSLWDDAYDKICETQSAVDFGDVSQLCKANRNDAVPGFYDDAATADSSSPLDICSEVLRLAKEQEARSQEKGTWHLIGTDNIAVRTFFGQIASSVQKFVSIGDVIAQVDPVHVGLPWAGVRIILLISVENRYHFCWCLAASLRKQLATQNHAKDIAVLQGLATISNLIFRYNIFEEVYLRGSCSMQGSLRLGLERALKDLYSVALLFLLKAHKFLAQNPGKRFLNAAVSADDLERLSKDLIRYEAELQRFELLELKKFANEQFMSIRESLGAYDDHLEGGQREKVLDWISTIDYRNHHLAIYDKVTTGTGKRLFERSEFVQWRHSPASSLLWLRGDGR